MFIVSRVPIAQNVLGPACFRPLVSGYKNHIGYFILYFVIALISIYRI